MKWQPVTVYELVREPSAETTIADVLVGVVFVVMGLIAVALAFGLAFAGGWTPCVGPILGSILTLAATNPSISFNLLLAYSLGLGIPFIIMGCLITQANRFVSRVSRHLKYATLILGTLIIFLGVLVFTNQLAVIASFPLLNNIFIT